MNANQAAKDYISKLEGLKKQSYQILLAQLKELGATPDKPIKFDWYYNQDAPCVIANCFGDDVADTYVKSIYADGDWIYVSLWSYYQQCSTEDDLLTDVCTDYDDIIDYLTDWNWDDNYEDEDEDTEM